MVGYNVTTTWIFELCQKQQPHTLLYTQQIWKFRPILPAKSLIAVTSGLRAIPSSSTIFIRDDDDDNADSIRVLFTKIHQHCTENRVKSRLQVYREFLQPYLFRLETPWMRSSTSTID